MGRSVTCSAVVVVVTVTWFSLCWVRGAKGKNSGKRSVITACGRQSNRTGLVGWVYRYYGEAGAKICLQIMFSTPGGGITDNRNVRERRFL